MKRIRMKYSLHYLTHLLCCGFTSRWLEKANVALVRIPCFHLLPSGCFTVGLAPLEAKAIQLLRYNFPVQIAGGSFNVSFGEAD